MKNNAFVTALLAFFILLASCGGEEPTRTSQLVIRVASALALLLAAVGGAITVGWLVILVALVLVVQVGIDVGARMHNQPPLIESLQQ